MENWFDLSFSTGGMVGHLSYVLLVISMMMRDISWLRLFVIASALTGIAYDLVWLKNPVGVFWESLLLIVNFVQLYLLWRRNRAARFSEEEAGFIAERLHGLSPGRCRDLLDLGRWEDLAEGVELTRQGEAPEFLTYVSQGTAAVLLNGSNVAEITAGNYVGEMSLLGDGKATATVVTRAPCRVWRIEFDKVARLKADRPTISNALEAGIAADMRRKIVAANVGNRLRSGA